MFAVIKTGGRQFRVVPDDVLEIGKIAGDVGTIVQLGEVMVVGGDTPVLGFPFVSGASVAAEVLDHKRGPKVISFKKRRRKNSKRKRGYRDEITVIRVTEILTDGKAPSVGPRRRRKRRSKRHPLRVMLPPRQRRRLRPRRQLPRLLQRPRQESRAEGEGRQEVK
jgi:large subunit ribosomal protein L21